MTKQNHLIQIERSKVLLKRLLAAAVTLSLIIAFLTIPQSAYAAYAATLSGNTATLTGDSTNDQLILGTDSSLASLLVAPAVYTSTLSGNIATLTGDATAETIIIDVSGGNLQHNRFTAGDAGFNSNIDWNTTQLGDQTLANAPGVTVRIRAGDGNDTITLGTLAAPASLLLATFDLSGQGHTTGDTLIINDSSAATARNVTVSSGAITGIGGFITYSGIESIQLTTGAGSDTINVGGVSNSLDGIKTVTVNSGVATDTLNLNDQGNAISNTYTLSSTSVLRSGGVTINYSNAESLLLNTGTSTDTITVQNSLALTPIQINSGNGDDSFNVGNAFNSLDNLQSALTIDGGASGTDSVTLVDTSELDANTYTITPNSVQRGPAVINYNTTVDNLIVNAGISTDTLVVTGTLGLAVNTYSVTSSSIQRSGVATITYNAAVDNLLLNGGSTADIFNLLSMGIPTTLNGDAGGDTFAFADGVTLLGGKINGGAGPDKLEYIAYTTPVAVNLASNTATGTAGISSIKDVTGGLGNDTLTGNPSANIINGGPGNDTYNFSTGWGDDTIIEEAGAGSDSMNFSSVTANLTLTLSSVNVTDGLNTATHSASEIESVVSGSGDDTFHVNASALSSHSISIDGGPHPTGDVLNFNAAGHTVITNTTTITAEGQQPLFYSQIEQVNITSTTPVFLPIILK